MKRTISRSQLAHNAKNVRQAISRIRRNLTSDLLPKKWVGLNQKIGHSVIVIPHQEVSMRFSVIKPVIFIEPRIRVES